MVSKTTLKIIKKKRPKPRTGVIAPIKERFSPRFFSSEKIPEKDLAIIFEAARWAPSGKNLQPWHFYYAEKGTDGYKKIMSCIPFFNRWCQSAPVLIVGCYINEKNPYAKYDLGAAVISLVLQAQSLGYYSRQMGVFAKEKLKERLKIDKKHYPFVIIALGKIGDYSQAPRSTLLLEFLPHGRKTDLVKKF